MFFPIPIVSTVTRVITPEQAAKEKREREEAKARWKAMPRFDKLAVYASIFWLFIGMGGVMYAIFLVLTSTR